MDELDKQSDIKYEWGNAQEFIEWLKYEKGIVLCHVSLSKYSGLKYHQVKCTTQELLAEFFDIDWQKLQKEIEDKVVSRG